MKKTYILFSVIIALLLFSGCTQKETPLSNEPLPEISAEKQIDNITDKDIQEDKILPNEEVETLEDTKGKEIEIPKEMFGEVELDYSVLDVTPKLIHTTNSFIKTPRMHNNNLVWLEVPENVTDSVSPDYPWHYHYYELFFKNIEAGQIIQITNNNDSEIRNHGVSDDYIVWEEHHFKPEDGVAYPDYKKYRKHIGIFYYNIATGETSQIAAGTGRDLYEPELHNNKVVYWEKKNWAEEEPDKRYKHSVGDVYLFDLDTKQETAITENGYSYSPKIYNNIVAWLNNEDVYYKNLSTGEIKQVTDDDRYRVSLSVSGKYIAWNLTTHSRMSASTGGIQYYNMQSGKIKYLPELKHFANRTQSEPRLVGSLLIYSASSGGYTAPADLYLYDIAKQKTEKPEGSSLGKDFYGNGLVTWYEPKTGLGADERKIYYYSYR